jgi:hypothetical protein
LCSDILTIYKVDIGPQNLWRYTGRRWITRNTRVTGIAWVAWITRTTRILTAFLVGFFA